MGKSSPAPPPAPDYAGAAREQGAANKEAAIASSRLNNPNVINPYGAQTFAEGVESDSRPTVTQTFSPAQQALFEQSLRTQGLLGGLGERGASAVGEVVGQNLDMSGLPEGPGEPGQIRDDVVNAMMARVNTDYGRATDQKRADLIAGGIPVTSDAYGREMDILNRGLNDARQQAIIAGTGAAGQDFTQTQVRRKDALAEALLRRQTPLNEINALLSGSQVQNPFAVPSVAQNATISPAPVFAATQAAGDYGTDVYNAKVSQQNAMTSGLFGLGGAALGGWGYGGFKTPWGK